jgi:hypothetical protein
LISLAAEEEHQATKLKWEKLRWKHQQPEGWRAKQLLGWVTEHKGYEVLDVDLRAVSDEQLQERLDAFLAEHPQSSTKEILRTVEGNDARLRELLKSGRYGVEDGPYHAKLYSLGSDDGFSREADVVQLPGIPHE